MTTDALYIISFPNKNYTLKRKNECVAVTKFIFLLNFLWNIKATGKKKIFLYYCYVTVNVTINSCKKILLLSHVVIFFYVFLINTKII